MMDIGFPATDINQSSMSLPSPRSLGFLFPNFTQGEPATMDSPGQASHSSNASPQGAIENTQINAIDYASELWNMETFWEDYLRPLPMSLDLGMAGNDARAVPQTPQDREDEAERIAYLFHQQTCHTLSIEEDADQNPWKTLIWPLAKEYPALYHAIAALTCFGISKQQPQLRTEGARHVHRSTQLLSENVEKGEIPLDAALAATLALGFAETWDDENLSNGANHIRAGGILLQQILSNQGNVRLSGEEEARVSFLAHTWTYMDVLARFTCSDLAQPYSGNSSSPDLNLFIQDPSKLDPLMGYSTTFFPIMRRVADLINKVRARETPRNSPAIISQALELRRAIEQWALPIDLEAIDDPSQNMTDAIQTAEAYRWSSLLMLYQAVPELPNLTSYGELAQRVLVYLATIPPTSTTIIVHIFPLIVAGCDTVEEEDRQFVRERWSSMSQRMVTGIVDRCMKITEELWKRREDYLFSRGLLFTSNGMRINNTVSNESAALSKDIASFINFGTSPGANTTSSSGSAVQVNERVGRKGNDFPISAAFKKGVDMLTRTGCTEYTVRGRLHWLGVMNDWNWQVMLG
ncbi:hypothetical protein CC86DRAFT_470491 [Ophiobolus disseminans]|uniref:Transcription factor domain-containing protein n=1 Tax=Ophiobolus disseminans TaxID=1469910 RepID=A0A6A6ZMF1_9PLEO|nr:hypothetical protein CC86DRAFT_470491 [Ophiobolus disseminans]